MGPVMEKDFVDTLRELTLPRRVAFLLRYADLARAEYLVWRANRRAKRTLANRRWRDRQRLARTSTGPQTTVQKGVGMRGRPRHVTPKRLRATVGREVHFVREADGPHISTWCGRYIRTDVVDRTTPTTCSVCQCEVRKQHIGKDKREREDQARYGKLALVAPFRTREMKVRRSSRHS